LSLVAPAPARLCERRMLGSAVSAWQPERVPDLVQTTRLF